MHVFLIAAITQDGYISRQKTESAVWSSKEDKQFFHARTKQAGLLIMGGTTYQTIGRPLPGRTTIIYTNHPENFPESIDLANMSPDTSLYTTKLPLPELIKNLSEKNYPELAVCGGTSIYTQFMKSGLVDTLYLTRETNITFEQGMPLFSEPISLPAPISTTNLSPSTILEEYHLH
jgi:dihydrofolate reductase